jgi:hypothetical protein
LGSTRKLGLNLEKAVKQSKFTPPSPIKATPTELASNSNIVSDWEIASDWDIPHPATLNPAILSNPVTLSCPVTFSNLSTLSNADDVMLTSPSKSEDVHNNNSTPTTSNPPKFKTTAVIAVMRGNLKDGYTCLCSNKHCKQRIVRVLLDRGSGGNLIFVSKDKHILLPYSKRLVP